MGVVISSFGAFGQGIAIVISSYSLSCFSAMLLGIAMDCAGFYRYAAADCVKEAQKPRATSYVLTGGLMAALIGSEIVRNTVNIPPPTLSMRAAFSLCVVQFGSLVFLAGLKIPKPADKSDAGRPIGVFLRMPVFVVAMLSSAIGYGLMSYMMTAAPLQVVNVVKLGTSANVTIIQWHVVLMFAPSFFTGSLIARFGAPRSLWAGLLAYTMTIVTA